MDDTLLIFTSDNGPEGKSSVTGGSTGGLRGRKRDDFEGGIRVPAIVRWPGKIEAGTVSDIPVIGSDIFSTVLEAAGVAVPTDRTIDGVSMIPTFSDETPSRPIPMFWRTHVSSPDSRVAMRIDDWKIVANDTLTELLLFRITDDPEETNNLAASNPEKLSEMKAKLTEVWNGIEEEGPNRWWEGEKTKPKEGSTLAY